MHALIEQHRDQIAALCRTYGVRRLELFGSAARDDFNPTSSDIDFFYEFNHPTRPGLADRFFEFHAALEKLLGAKVDLVSSTDATNPYFLQTANRDRVTLYAA